MTWYGTFLHILKENEVCLVAYVPDNVLTPLIRGIAADNYFIPDGATREDEAVGTAMDMPRTCLHHGGAARSRRMRREN